MEKHGARPHCSRRLAMVQRELVADLLIISTGALKHHRDLLSIKPFYVCIYPYIFLNQQVLIPLGLQPAKITSHRCHSKLSSQEGIHVYNH